VCDSVQRQGLLRQSEICFHLCVVVSIFFVMSRHNLSELKEQCKYFSVPKIYQMQFYANIYISIDAQGLKPRWHYFLKKLFYLSHSDKLLF